MIAWMISRLGLGLTARPLATLLLLVGWGLATSQHCLLADSPTIGFLAAEPSLDAMGPHNRAAWQMAETLGQATLLTRRADGQLVDPAGAAKQLADFDVVWYHQGDAIRRTSLYGGPGLTAIRRFVSNGGGILLSGGALAMVDQLGLELNTRAQRHDLENYRDPAGMVIVETSHPAFSGLPTDGSTIWLSRGGCRAVGDFYWGGPAYGMLLATTPHGPENPLVEYTLGSGRVIVFGWHWPDYADVESPHLANLTQVTSNLLGYLADSSVWRPIVIRSEFPPVASPDEPGVSRDQWRALRMAIEDLSGEFPERYPNGVDYLGRLNSLRLEQEGLPRDAASEAFDHLTTRFENLKREALLANPLLDFQRLMAIRRKADQLGLPLNFNGNSDLAPTGYGNSLVSFSPVIADGPVETVFTPEGDRFIGDLDLHYDADRLLLSTADASGRWVVAELDLRTKHLAELPLVDEPDVHNYDSCYLPDGRIVFTSTAPIIGVPCVGGKSHVANLYLRELDGRIRRLTNDQDHNWCPEVLNNGQILYQRWEYADIAHAFTRLLFHANPDGSRQMEYYGSNSFWPTALFYARPVPGHPTKVMGVIGGHHDAPRQGELIVFDPALGRHEADGAVQRIPGYGKKVEPVILDGLIGTSWPRFLHPYPLSEKYVLAACKPTQTSLWGIYLVDVFDNFVLLREEPGFALLEPTPLRARPRPPVLPDVVDTDRKDAAVLLADVYQGPGLRGVPRGTVKSLRLISYEFTFHGMGGEPDRVGFDGPWDVKRILGSVPVEADGSAYFRVPAATPVAVQPLDADGKALALMRSWFTAAPGETLSCVGCHEQQNTAPPYDVAPLAARRQASEIVPWYGPARGFSFVREVQPVLDAYCVECHYADGESFDLTARPAEDVPSAMQMQFTPSYTELHRFVHTPTLESDAHLLSPRDFHADSSKLIQILRDGHYGVRLNAEARDRLITWIDLNAPAHGTWAEVVGHIPAKAALVEQGAARRRELHLRHTGIDEDPEAVYPAAVLVARASSLSREDEIPLWGRAEGRPSVGSNGEVGRPAPSDSSFVSLPLASKTIERIELVDGAWLELARIEPGRYVMGSEGGYPNERPTRTVAVENSFWMGRFEVTNQQYASFDPSHNSGLETGEQYAFGDYERGPPLDRPEQPVVRVSHDRAVAFCDWLSRKTGKRFMLPSEEQWEYACRAGSVGELSYGGIDDDFSLVANLSDATHHTVNYPHVPTVLPPWRPADTRFDDHWRVSAPVGSFQPNAWGLFDMHGNVAEWTRSVYANDRRTVRGGSWLDRPRRARSAFRLHYEKSQAVHDVGFRLVMED